MKFYIQLSIEILVLWAMLAYTRQNALRIGRETAQIEACKRPHAPTIATFGFSFTNSPVDK